MLISYKLFCIGAQTSEFTFLFQQFGIRAENYFHLAILWEDSVNCINQKSNDFFEIENLEIKALETPMKQSVIFS